MTWNVEGLHRNIHSLKYFIDLHKRHLVFLSEPQTFQCDAAILLQPVRGCYSYHLNSEDLHTPDMVLNSSKAKGGTMILWKTSLDPFVSIIPTNTPSVVAVLLKVPGYIASVHVAIYLPTAGQEVQFISALSNLDTCLGDLLDKSPHTPFLYVEMLMSTPRTNQDPHSSRTS